jgi:hypothetical protein
MPSSSGDQTRVGRTLTLGRGAESSLDAETSNSRSRRKTSVLRPMMSARTARIDDNLGRGTDGSNPLPSSGESGTNCTATRHDDRPRPSDPVRLLHDANSQLEAIQGLAAVNAGVVVKCAPAQHLGRRLWRGEGARSVGEDARPNDGVCRRGDGRLTPALPRPLSQLSSKG